MAVLLAIGILLVVVGIALLVDLFGAGGYVMRNVTMRYLGSLPPGYAATQRGFRVYALLVVAIGLVFAGLGAAETSVALGIPLLAAGVVGFVVLSVLALRGEAETARGHKG